MSKWTAGRIQDGTVIWDDIETGDAIVMENASYGAYFCKSTPDGGQAHEYIGNFRTVPVCIVELAKYARTHAR